MPSSANLPLRAFALVLMGMVGCPGNPCLESGGSCEPLTEGACLGAVPSALSCAEDSSAMLCCLPRVPATAATLECH